MDIKAAKAFIDTVWGETILPALCDYIRIPNQSPHFDPEWAENGYMDEAVELVRGWCARHRPANAVVRVVRLPNRTPVLTIDIPGNTAGHILFYGHLDKQPEMTGWADGLGPRSPVIRDDKLYGQGGADDGYAVFATLTAFNVLQAQGIPHPRAFMLLECSKESGSHDLPEYMEYLADNIGSPDMVVCLNSGSENYEQLWMTTSLRGLISGTLRINVLKEGVHSGDASGIIASSFRILRRVLNRIEDPDTGALLLDHLNVDIPRHRKAQAKAAAAILGPMPRERFPCVPGMEPVHFDVPELLLNRTWRPALSYTGIDGMPTLSDARHVVRPGTSIHLSLRTPPTVNASEAYDALKALLESNPPYGADIHFEGRAVSGWHSPLLRPWFHGALETVSKTWFGESAMYLGDGGTIPLVGQLGEKFPQAQFMITGVLGPNSNANGANECLHIPAAKRLTGCLAQLVKIQGERALIDA